MSSARSGKELQALWLLFQQLRVGVFPHTWKYVCHFSSCGQEIQHVQALAGAMGHKRAGTKPSGAATRARSTLPLGLTSPCCQLLPCTMQAPLWYTQRWPWQWERFLLSAETKVAFLKQNDQVRTHHTFGLKLGNITITLQVTVLFMNFQGC